MLFENRVKEIYDSNVNKLKSLGTYFTFPDLLTLELHPAVIKYISAEIDYLIFEDRQKLLSESMFDYSGEKIDEYFEKISAEIKKSKRISQEYVAKLVLYSITFNVNFLTRPNWTLEMFIFEKSDSKPVEEIKKILEYVYYYKYLKDVLAAYFEKKKLLSINSEEFSGLLKNIQEIGKESYLSKMLNTLLSSTSDFLNQVGSRNSIPTEAVELFLKEKELDTHLQAVNSNFTEEELDLEEIKKVFQNPDEYLVAGNTKEEDTNSEQTASEDDAQSELQFEFEESSDSSGESSSGNSSFNISLNNTEEQEKDSGENQSVQQEEAESEVKEQQDLEEEQQLEEHSDEDVVFEIDGDDEALNEPEFDETSPEFTEEYSSKDRDVSEEEEKEESSNVPEQEREESTEISEKTEAEEVERDEFKEYEKSDIREEEFADEPVSDNAKPGVDIAQFLDSKQINRIVEIIFDYDMDDFLTSMDWIIDSNTKEEADNKLTKILEDNGVKVSSKEAQILYKVISEYYSSAD